MSSWSELTSDVLHLILERLSIIDIFRAQSVCKNWYRVSKDYLIEKKLPWMIIFPSTSTRTMDSSCQLLNPQEGSFFKLNNLVNNFFSSRCVATSGSWLLMFHIGSKFYILNIFTRERINLPPLESNQGRLRVEHGEFRINKSSITMKNVFNQSKAVLWVDDKTNNYIVVWSIGDSYIMFTKSGFDLWREIPTREGPDILHGCKDLVYKNNKLYILSKQKRIRILDFSQELPIATSNNVYDDPFTNDRKRRDMIICVTVSGDVLIVKNRVRSIFNIYKIGLEGKGWDIVESLGNESWIADLGMTIPAINGTSPNTFCFCKDRNAYCCNVSTRSLVIRKHFMSNEFGFARWFISTFS